MRRDVSKARSFAKNHNVERVYGTAKDLIHDETVDCVYVATPPGGSRVEIAREIVKSGKPCYMEKPLARDATEAQEIASLFAKAGLPLYCAYYRRCLPKFDAVRRNLGLIGPLTSVAVTLHWPRHLEDKSHWHYDRPVSGGGLLLDVGCHALDLVDYLVGPLEDCRGVAVRSVADQGWIPGRMDVEDNVRGWWAHRKDGRQILGSCSFNFCSPREDELYREGKRDEIRIEGLDGSLSFSCFDKEPPRLQTTSGSNTTVRFLHAEEPQHVHQPMVQDIVNELRSINESPRLCSGEDAVRTSRVMDQLLNARERWDDDYV